MTDLRRLVVVGASLAGLTAVETCRELGYDGELTMVGLEKEAPYDRPPLSKGVLEGLYGSEQAVLRPPGHYEELRVNMLLGTAAVGLDPLGKNVLLQGGEKLPFDGLVLATGARPRMLAGGEGLKGVYTLRTLEDCLKLRAAFVKGSSVVIVGAGFIGAEVASTARNLGLEVTVLETQNIPLSGVLGEKMGGRCGQLHVENDVDLRCGVSVESFVGSDHVEGVRLADGSVVSADVVVVAIGVAPNTSWLGTSGLLLANGIDCDEYCSTGLPGIYAIGDVASCYNPLYRQKLRVEHWSNACDHGRVAAHNLLALDGKQLATEAIPYFWSDQYGTKIQCVGYTAGADDVRIVRDDADRRRLSAVYGRRGRLVGAVTFNNSRDLVRYRTLIANEAALASVAS